MDILSLEEYERRQETVMEIALDSAVDQLESLAHHEGQARQADEMIIRFGELELGDGDRTTAVPYRFDYEPPSPYPRWPGIHYGALPLHRKLSKPSRKGDPPPKTLGVKSPRKDRKVKQKVRSVGGETTTWTASIPPPRDTPLHLLLLPPEIRNAIWSLLAISPAPLHAQLRSIQPCKKVSRSRSRLIRRFPCEPVVAAVNHQLRKEVLSIFYGANNFVLQKCATVGCTPYNITDPKVLRRWKPSVDVASYLSKVSLKIGALSGDVPAKQAMLVYKLNRKTNGELTIDVCAESPNESMKRFNDLRAFDCDQICFCREAEWVRHMDFAAIKLNLAEVAAKIVEKRAARKDSNFGSREECEQCGKMEFKYVYTVL